MGLEWARLQDDGPNFVAGRQRGARAQGLRFEGRFGKYLAKNKFEALSQQWIAFVDANGPGHARPDYFITFEDRIILFECKLSQTEHAFLQIDGLYRPLLKHIFNRPVVGVQVCKNVRTRGEYLEDIYAAIALRQEGNYVMHWLGFY